MKIPTSWTRIVRKTTVPEKLRRGEEGKMQLKRRRLRLGARPPVQMKATMPDAKRRRKGPEIRLIAPREHPPKKKPPLKGKKRGHGMSQPRKLSQACVVCATPKVAPRRKKRLHGGRKRSGQGMMTKAFQPRPR